MVVSREAGAAETAADNSGPAKSAGAIKRIEFAALCIILLDGLGFGILVPMLPFIALYFHATPIIVTTMFASYAGAGLIGSLLAGEMSDRFGRRAVVIGTMIGSIACNVMALLVWTLPAIFLARATSGIMTGRDGVLRAVVTDNAPRDQHVKIIGRLTAINILGAALGPGLSSLLVFVSGAGVKHFEFAYVLAVVMTAAALLFTVSAWRPESLAGREAAPRVTIAMRRAAIVAGGRHLLLNSLGALSFSTILSCTALFGSSAFHWTAYETGWVIVAIAIAAGTAPITVVPYSVKRFGAAAALWGWLTISGLAFLAAGLATTPLQFVSGVAVASTSLTAVGILATTAISQSAPPAMRGLVFGVTQGFWALSLVTGATLSGLLFQTVGRGAPFLMGAFIAFAAVPLALRRHQSPGPASN